MSHSINFKGYVVVSCGILRPELEFLKEVNFLNADRILYTAPGLHENTLELERHLNKQINNAKKYSQKIIVIYGDKCYVDINNPSRDIDVLIQEAKVNTERIKAKNCIDMLASIDEREKISEGKKVYWLSPGWLEYWKVIFKDWDQGKANETFPQHDKAIVLDALGIFERYSEDLPEKIFEFSDWMGISIEPYKISLERLKRLLSDKIIKNARE